MAKLTHYACFVNDRGRELQKSCPVTQSQEDFDKLYQCICQVMCDLKKTEVIVGIELTGHYWLNLAYFFSNHGIPLAMRNPMHVKRSKELNDNLPTKNDRKDALVKDGRFNLSKYFRRCGSRVTHWLCTSNATNRGTGYC
ncbi:transposase [Viridibacillus sp. YIM B01967]|uniref:Transposase n=1 Tax=Viridibacillus soli TaxID=2798301 RepID=A0ABS1HCF9_9BACL|nr:transposase [Viridibacillus soli]